MAAFNYQLPSFNWFQPTQIIINDKGTEGERESNMKSSEHTGLPFRPSCFMRITLTRSLSTENFSLSLSHPVRVYA